MKKLIASDYDGTVSCGGDSISVNAEAIRRWRKAGNLFGIVTGRGTPIRKELADHGVETDFILCNNGSVCILNGELAFAERNPISRIPEMVEFINGQGAGYFGLVAPERERGFNVFEMPDDLLDFPDFVQLTAMCGSDDDADRISAAINAHFDGAFSSYANGSFIDIVRYGISKATGISRVAGLLGVDEKYIYSVGDNCNDIVMIDAFHGYAVENARSIVKEHAKHVVPGVAAMIDSLI